MLLAVRRNEIRHLQFRRLQLRDWLFAVTVC